MYGTSFVTKATEDRNAVISLSPRVYGTNHRFLSSERVRDAPRSMPLRDAECRWMTLQRLRSAVYYSSLQDTAS